ncbi:MAG: globin [Pirellulaceae bacterium]|jgi:hemoglobin|nr:globin [Pirellulaceae bacterium]
MGENEIYAAIGSAGLERLCAAFYRQVPNDELLGPMYPADDWAGAEQRLRDFLIYRFGGPQTYIAERGHPRLRGRHAPFAIDRERRDRWMLLMNRAIDEAELPGEVSATMREFFEHIATFLINQSDS